MGSATGTIMISILFGAISLFCLGWMLRNTIVESKREGISMKPTKRFSQTKGILLKPFLVFTEANFILIFLMLFMGWGNS